MITDDVILMSKMIMAHCVKACPSPARNSKYATGNLISTLKCDVISPDFMCIHVGGAQAPYMPYTNEKWISPRWKGKKNPNENWWDNAIAQAIDVVAKMSRGKVEDNR